MRIRRRVTRERRRGTSAELEEEYKAARKALRREIYIGKSDSWKALLEELNEGEHPFGEAYKIVTGKPRKSSPLLMEEESSRIIGDLFSAGDPPLPLLSTPGEPFEFPGILDSEIDHVLGRLKPRRAPGGDLVPTEAVESFIRRHPDTFRNMMTNILRAGKWPDRWKTARLVLIPKSGASTYRPISCLASLSKAAEHLAHLRPSADAECKGMLSESQHGFRSFLSTRDAIPEVMNIAAAQREIPVQRRPHCLVVLLDVRNAFNTLPFIAHDRSESLTRASD